jgi:hypothetical protein
MKHNCHNKKALLVGPNQNVVQFADFFELRLELLVILQPLLHLRQLLRADAELLSLATRITDCQDPGRMPAAGSTFRAAAFMVDHPLQQRPAQDFAVEREVLDQLFPSAESLLMFH